jgi:DNA-binding NtrC family response regulator
MKVQRFGEAADLAARTLKLTEYVQFRQLSPLLLLLRAEARAFLGDPAAAADDLATALIGHDEPPLEMLGEAHRVLGRALALQHDEVGAFEAFNRSARILHALGHLRAARDVRQQAATAGLPIPETTGTAVPAPPALPPGRPELLVQRTAALVEEAARPDLLGSEALGVLAAAGAIRGGVVIARDDAGVSHAETVLGWTREEALGAVPDGSLTVPLGSWRERDWTLVADVRDGLAARTTWASVRALAVSGVALAAARHEAREREALWPIDNPDTPSPGLFLGEQMIELLRTTRRIASTDTLVLLTGETGVGKEVLARIIHDASSRAGRAFVPFNCSAVPRDMLESQLFGHSRGAFTGADHASPGVIRAAEGGTLFLDEIGEVTLDVQPKLLRFLEQREVHPLGEPQPSKVDVRVVAATNRQLDELVREGRFREDLYYRLNVITVPIPPLRERREEIPGLAEHFLGRFARENHKGRLRIADETMEYLVLYAWPGNVRQLMNELRRMATLAETDAVLMPEHLHHTIVSTRRTRPASERELQPTEVVVRLDQPLAAGTEHLERAMIQHAMSLCDGRLEQVARMLGLSRKGLYLKRQRLGFDVSQN